MRHSQLYFLIAMFFFVPILALVGTGFGLEGLKLNPRVGAILYFFLVFICAYFCSRANSASNFSGVFGVQPPKLFRHFHQEKIGNQDIRVVLQYVVSQELATRANKLSKAEFDFFSKARITSYPVSLEDAVLQMKAIKKAREEVDFAKMAYQKAIRSAKVCNFTIPARTKLILTPSSVA